MIFYLSSQLFDIEICNDLASIMRAANANMSSRTLWAETAILI